jgi:hypothetical protein
MAIENGKCDQIKIFKKKLEDEYRALMNLVQTEFVTSYKEVNLTIVILTIKMKEIMINITEMNGLFVKCPDIISSNILGFDLNMKLEALGIMAESIIEEYNEIVCFAEKQNANLILQSQIISSNVQSIVKQYNGLNFIDIYKQLQNFVDTNTKNRQFMEKYIGNIESCGQTVKNIISEVEQIITIPLA